jgi:hypothetical protein
MPTPAFAWGRLCVGMTMWKQPLRHVEHLFPGESSVELFRDLREVVAAQQGNDRNRMSIL